VFKLEWFNPTGSYKDRMALAMIEEAEDRGDLRPGMTVVEYTGGSTGSSLAYVCATTGDRLRVVSCDAFSVESDGGRITPDLLPRMIETAERFAAEPDAYWTDQLNNRDSLVGYRGDGHGRRRSAAR